MKKRTLLYTFAIVLLLALFALLFIYVKQTFRVKVTKGWVHHTLEVITQSEKIHRLATQETMAHRGYIITNDSAYLKPSFTARRELATTLHDLSESVKHNPNQAKLLNNIIRR